MQVMPFWVPELGYKDKNQLFDVEINVLLGAAFPKWGTTSIRSAAIS